VAYDRYSGWGRRTEQESEAPLKPGTDTQHVYPDPTPEWEAGIPPLWVNSAGAPLLPDEVIAAQRARVPATGLDLDQTPVSHFYGRGTGPGLTTQESQDVMGPWHNDDTGVVAYEASVPMVDRDARPGSPHVDFIDYGARGGASPETLRFKEEGIEGPYDGGVSRVGRRMQRWRDRYIDRHTYETERRPVAPKTAYRTQAQPSPDNPTQLDSPWPTSATYYAGPMDKFVPQVVRRLPRPYGEPLATDGGYQASEAYQNYGLRTYGL
jgi:hypothetical protein